MIQLTMRIQLIMLWILGLLAWTIHIYRLFNDESYYSAIINFPMIQLILGILPVFLGIVTWASSKQFTKLLLKMSQKS